MITRFTILVKFMLIVICAVAATKLVAQDSDELTADKKKAVIASLAKAIDELYLYQDRVSEVQQELQKRLDAGEYKDVKSHYALATKLTDDLRTFTKDLHFAVRHGRGDGNSFGAIRLGGGGGTGGSAAGGDGQQRAVRIGSGATLDPESPMYKMLHEQFRKNNFSMPKLEVLDGNVGYLRLDMMPPLEVARPTLDAAMMFLSNTDAMIIDVRDTPGGVGGFIPYFMSYFFPEGGKLLFTRYFGAEDRSDRFLTSDKLGGKRRPDLPLYILTSSSTGSAAENLAFTLKNHGRATTVGETTRGGGHSARMVPLVDGFTATIPAADVIHPKTGKGFDGVGVIPNVEVSASDGLVKAHELALESLIQKAAERDKVMLDEALAELRATRELKRGGEIDTKQLEVFVGQYGARSVFIEDGKLKYRRTGGPAIELKPLGMDTFRMRTPPGVRSALALPNVRFERDDDKQVKGFSLVRDDKVEQYVKKDAE